MRVARELLFADRAQPCRDAFDLGIGLESANAACFFRGRALDGEFRVRSGTALSLDALCFFFGPGGLLGSARFLRKARGNLGLAQRLDTFRFRAPAFLGEARVLHAMRLLGETRSFDAARLEFLLLGDPAHVGGLACFIGGGALGRKPQRLGSAVHLIGLACRLFGDARGLGIAACRFRYLGFAGHSCRVEARRFDFELAPLLGFRLGACQHFGFPLLLCLFLGDLFGLLLAAQVGRFLCGVLAGIFGSARALGVLGEALCDSCPGLTAGSARVGVSD